MLDEAAVFLAIVIYLVAYVLYSRSPRGRDFRKDYWKDLPHGVVGSKIPSKYPEVIIAVLCFPGVWAILFFGLEFVFVS